MKDFKTQIAEIFQKELPEIEPDEVKALVEVPSDSKMGDYAFPCFKLAKTMHKAPQAIASELAERVSGNELFEKVEQVNAYVNIFVSKSAFLKETLEEVLEKKDDYGRSDIGAGKKVIVEYSSPNIAKPFHIGHIRSTVIGNSIYKIYDFLGYDTVRINHLGDYGTQFGKMIVAYRHWGNEEDVRKEPIKTLLSYYTKFHVEAEDHPELEDEARETFTKLEHGEKEEVELWQWFRDESLKEFNRVYDMLGISFDSYAGESFYSDKMPAMVEELEASGLVKESRGAQIVDLEEYGLGVALIKKSDGSSLYCTRDLTCANYRHEHYHFYKNLYIVASQQNLYFQQWKKILELMGKDWAKDCVHIPFGLVSLAEGTMSTRAGRVVFLEDVLNRAVEQTRQIVIEKNVNTDNVDQTAKEVGIGAVIFNELSNNRIKDYVFSWDKVLDFNGETGPYVQYTHARAASILRNAGIETVDPASVSKLDAKYISGDSAFELARAIYDFPDAVMEAAERYEPSVVTRHLVDVAKAFNRFYHDEHILVENADERAAKLALVAAAKTVLKNALGLLGMAAPEKM